MSKDASAKVQQDVMLAWTKMLAVHRTVEDGFRWRKQDFLEEDKGKRATQD